MMSLLLGGIFGLERLSKPLTVWEHKVECRATEDGPCEPSALDGIGECHGLLVGASHGPSSAPCSPTGVSGNPYKGYKGSGTVHLTLVLFSNAALNTYFTLGTRGNETI